jgi:hypothetical protein
MGCWVHCRAETNGRAVRCGEVEIQPRTKVKAVSVHQCDEGVKSRTSGVIDPMNGRSGAWLSVYFSRDKAAIYAIQRMGGPEHIAGNGGR